MHDGGGFAAAWAGRSRGDEVTVDGDALRRVLDGGDLQVRQRQEILVKAGFVHASNYVIHRICQRTKFFFGARLYIATPCVKGKRIS